MNEELFEILLSIFEYTLNQLKAQKLEDNEVPVEEASSGIDVSIFQYPSSNAIRVVTYEEQIKLTKPALQFLMRLMHTGMLSAEQFEVVMVEVLASPERYVALSEARQIVYHVLADALSFKELLLLQLSLDGESSSNMMH